MALANRVRSSLWLRYMRRRFPQVELGTGVVLYGLPLLQVARTGRLRIGDRVVLTSSPRANLVGLNRRCSIAVAPGALLDIGNDSGFSAVAIFAASAIRIGTRVACGGNVSIWDTDFHHLDAAARRDHPLTEIPTAPIEIGDDVFIGAHSLILKGVRIGERAIIGAGSVVARDVAPGEVWAGNPLRRIRTADGRG